jgi:hypothetical protein
LKQKRRAAAKDQLRDWGNERVKQVELRKSLNKQQEKDNEAEKRRLKDTTNPWERVVGNVEIQAA